MSKDVIASGYDVERYILENQDKLQNRFKHFGFKSMSDYVAYAKGFPIYLGGYDGSGKSEFTMELQLQLSELYGEKHLIFTGEVGKVEEVYLELYWKYGKKPYNKFNHFGEPYKEHQTEDERNASRQFINSHFLVVDALQVPEQFRFDDLTSELTNHLNIGLAVDDIDTISIDGVYEVSREDRPQTDQQLEALLNKVYRHCQKENRTIFMTTHVSAQNGLLKLPNGKSYPNIPTKYNWTMGMFWSRKGYQLINVYRPSPLYDYFGDGNLTARNEVWINSEKSKPKGLSITGTAKLYFDLHANRYYELIDGEKHFSRKWWEEESAIQPNLEFEKPPF